MLYNNILKMAENAKGLDCVFYFAFCFTFIKLKENKVDKIVFVGQAF